MAYLQRWACDRDQFDVQVLTNVGFCILMDYERALPINNGN